MSIEECTTNGRVFMKQVQILYKINTDKNYYITKLKDNRKISN